VSTARSSRKVASLPQYMAKLSAEQARVLRQVLALIQKAVPAAEPTISYSIPAFKLQRVFMYAAAFKSHIGIFPPVRDAKLRVALKPYANAKGNLRFALAQPVPRALITRVAKALAKQYEEAGGIRRTQPKKKAPTSNASPGPKTRQLQTRLNRMPGASLSPMSARAGSPPLALLYKVMGKMFAILSARGEEFVILKCDPNLVPVLRRQYQGVGHRSHLDKRYWISVSLDADVPQDEVERLADASYDNVCAGLTRKQKAELAGLTG
jgi:predicted DNA-binding protein (MmcQ/YjbR family)/uncharacterized protein YdhG (YjbR/CyaY superfamily)